MEDFGPYRIVRKIAAGGMAEIYLARHRGLEGLERTVVLKRILPTYGNNDEFVTMFLDEARLLAALSHPNIAQVFDLGKVEDTYYLVMEYVRGPTLGALLSAAAKASRNGLPEKESLGIALAIAEALAYVHDRKDELGRPLNIVHRDLNPANVLVSYDGAVKLIDFGIAKAATKVYETRTGVIKGTWGYSAPEQLTRAAPVDHRADVFALGILIYEMILGQHPFDASDEPNLLDRILGARYRRPRQVDPNVPQSLDRLIARCLAPHPEGRPEDVRHLITDLSAHMAAAGIVCTMGDIGKLATQLVPDVEGAAPLRPLRAPQRPSRRPFSSSEPSRTIQIPTGNASQPPPGSGEHGAPDNDDDEDEPTIIDDRALADVSTDEQTLSAGPPAQPSLEQVAAAALASPPLPDKPPPPELPSKQRDPLAGFRDIDTERLAQQQQQQASRKSSRLRQVGMMVGSAILIVGVGVAAFVTARAIGRATSAADAADVRQRPASPPPEGAGDPDTAAAPPPLRVVSEPAGAAVAVNGVEVPQPAPVEIALPADTERVWVRVSLDGYVTQERTVQAAVGEARFVLVPLVQDAGAAAEEDAQEKAPQRRRRFRRRR